jgi:hypothetical protein
MYRSLAESPLPMFVRERANSSTSKEAPLSPTHPERNSCLVLSAAGRQSGIARCKGNCQAFHVCPVLCVRASWHPSIRAAESIIKINCPLGSVRSGEEGAMTQSSHPCTFTRAASARSSGQLGSQSNKTAGYLPAPDAPFETASRNWLTVSPPLAWLGGYASNVCRNWLTITVAGTIVHSFSPHHLP